jgi:membrane fusion protein (multidrug efflux system)
MRYNGTLLLTLENPMTRLFIILTVICLSFSSCKKKNQEVAQGARKSMPVMAEGFLVTPQSISEDVEVPGSLLPAEETQIRPEVSGRVVQMNINEGSSVKKGELLVKLFDNDLKAQLNKLKVQLQINEKTVERQRDLLAISGISQQDFDLSALAVDNLKADIESIRISISKTEIRAPYDGRIGLRNVSLGSYISSSDLITTVRQVDRLKLDFSIPEKYAKNIAPGYSVKFKIDGSNLTHLATVLATEGNVESTTRTMRIKAIVVESHPELVPGIFAKINLQLGKDEKALLIPTQAIIPQARNKQIILFRKDSALFTVVETGIRDSSYVQILSGLKAGDTIVTTGLMSIRPKSKVKITKLNRY